MQIILLSESGRTHLQLCVGSLIQYLVIISVVLAGTIFFISSKSEPAPTSTDKLVSELHEETKAQQKIVADTIRTVEDNLDALVLRLGQMHANVIRLEALGTRLTKMSGLDEDEFSFGESPAVGGLFKPSESSGAQSVPDFLSLLESLANQLDDVAPKLEALESALMQGQLDAQVRPSGRPIKKGWISSYYGYRRDPFTGKKAFHEGIDFCAKLGSEVVAVASGVVVWSGPRMGYGKLLEINHGKGYMTRYGHNKELLVRVGDTVRKGDVIATVGSTGRSTGPHVHFEVIYNGKNINPIAFVKGKS